MSALSLQPETFYSSEEVSDFLHLSLRTVQRLLHNHTLPAYKIQGQYRIKVSAAMLNCTKAAEKSRHF